MKTLLLFLAALTSVQSMASDSGDRQCQIFLVGASNVITGGSGNYYEARVAVSKELLAKDPSSSDVNLLYQVRDEWKRLSSTGKPHEENNYLVFNFKFPFGATYYQDTLRLVPYVVIQQNRVFDNNFEAGAGYAKLDTSSNWSWGNHRCATY